MISKENSGALISLSLRYKEILAAYLESGQEAHLYQVNQLGKDLMKQGISPETVVEMHLGALRKINKDIGAYPKNVINESFRFLIEGINAYGIAYKEYLDSRTEGYLAEIKELNRCVCENLAEMTVLYETAKITGSSLELEDVLSSVFENAVKALKADNGSLMLLDPEEGVLTIKKAYGLDEEIIKKTRIKIGDSIAGLVAQSGESMIIHGKADSSLIIGREKYENVHSICAPLKDKKGIFGVINLNRKGDSEPFTEDNLRLLSTIAHEAAFAIENARLYEAVQKELVERKRAVEDLRASEEYARNIINSSLDMIIAIDKEERIIEFNKAAQETFGYSIEEILGKDVAILYADPHEHFAIHKTTVEKGRCVQEILNKRKNGEVFPSFISASILLNAQGELVGVMGISREITERKRAEENLLRSEKRYKRLVESVTDYIYTVEVEDGKAIAMSHSPGCVAVTGYTSEEYEANPDLWYRMVYEGDQKNVMEQAARVLSGETTPLLEHRIIHKDGSIRWVMNTSVPRYSEEGRLIACDGLIRDITERKRAEEEIKQEMEITANLLMIAEATASTADIDKLMEHIVQCSHEIINCNMCLGYIWDKEAEVFMPSQAAGLAYDMMPLFRTETLYERVDFVKKALDRRKPVIEQFGVEGSDFRMLNTGSALQWIKDINTMVVIPLIGRKDYLGLIIIICKKNREFSERDKRIFEGISHQVSIALEEARLYRDSIDRTMELTHKIETIQAMHDIDKAILSTLDPQAILDTAFIVISKVIPCERAAVALVDEEKGGLIYKAGLWVTFLQKGAFIPFKDTSAADVIKTGRPQYVANLEKVKDILPIEKRLLEEGFLSHIRVPLIVKGEVSGLLIIGARRPSAFTPENLLTLEKMASQIGIALENARLISDLEDLFIATVKTLSAAIDAKSPWTAGHSERVTRYALSIGKEIGLSEREIKDLELAGLLHDIGKIGTFDIILDKPGRLDSEEYEIVKKHPARGVELLEPIKQLRHITPWIRHHHEQYDGTGYPDSLKGEEIPLMARIIAVADTFDSMTAERPYRETPGRERAIEELKRCSGSQFDPKVAEVFLKVLKGETEYGS